MAIPSLVTDLSIPWYYLIISSSSGINDYGSVLILFDQSKISESYSVGVLPTVVILYPSGTALFCYPLLRDIANILKTK